MIPTHSAPSGQAGRLSYRVALTLTSTFGLSGFQSCRASRRGCLRAADGTGGQVLPPRFDALAAIQSSKKAHPRNAGQHRNP